ncbi:DUF1073 domain-containing protein (plasmid) [Borrelia sp. A-FGy1]|uniref:anti-CBASS Acb1 family protein n=1 Tax=Borrelia sp. A-FGy1 TaxID=2608247 RepID=UPI0015F4F674|nr:anti-CBASS Acb1 family protein [Borrelia sp. A-FGy1]QMU99658.1 DUF1073 domain-containing protein [Borrelia sp. A-FGy1]
MFRLKFLEKKKKSNARFSMFPLSSATEESADSLRLFEQVAEIYAGFAASRDIYNNKGDGLDVLFNKNFRAVIKHMVYKAILSGESFFHIIIADSDDASKPLRDDFSVLTQEFGQVWCAFDSKREDIHPTRVVKMSSSFLNFDSLKKSSKIMSELLAETVCFLRVNNFTFLKSATLPSVKDMTAHDLAEIKRNVDGALDAASHKMMILGREDDVSNVVRSVSPLRDAFEIIVSDITLHSGIPKEILYPVSPAGDASISNYDIFYLNIDQISRLMVAPFINAVLEKCHLKSNWSFKAIKPVSQKEQADIDEKHARTLGAYLDLLEKAKSLGNSNLFSEIEKQFAAYIANE